MQDETNKYNYVYNVKVLVLVIPRGPKHVEESELEIQNLIDVCPHRLVWFYDRDVLRDLLRDMLPRLFVALSSFTFALRSFVRSEWSSTIQSGMHACVERKG